MKNETKRSNQVEDLRIERLQNLLKSYGINNLNELDFALSKALEDMTIGIMTDSIASPANSA